MNCVDRVIERLRERFKLLTDSTRLDHGAAFQDGYRAAMHDATTEIEHTVRGLSTFEGYNLPDPKTTRNKIWCIPMMWDQKMMFSAHHDPEASFKTTCPRLELQRVETSRGVWGWMVMSQVWVP